MGADRDVLVRQGESVPPLTIGSDVWPGLAKLVEECGELVQVAMKILAYPDSPHPDGSDLLARLHEEMGDVSAALWFVQETAGGVDRKQVENRAFTKYARFRNWHKAERGEPTGA